MPSDRKTAGFAGRRKSAHDGGIPQCLIGTAFFRNSVIYHTDYPAIDHPQLCACYCTCQTKPGHYRETGAIDPAAASRGDGSDVQSIDQRPFHFNAGLDLLERKNMHEFVSIFLENNERILLNKNLHVLEPQSVVTGKWWNVFS